MTYSMARIAGSSEESETSFDCAVRKQSARVPDPTFPSNSEFHRRRAEVELERALTAPTWANAVRHLELARLHRVRRTRLARPDGRLISPSRELLCCKEG